MNQYCEVTHFIDILLPLAEMEPNDCILDPLPQVEPSITLYDSAPQPKRKHRNLGNSDLSVQLALVLLPVQMRIA